MRLRKRTFARKKKEVKREDELTTWVFEGFVPMAKPVNGKAYGIINNHIGKTYTFDRRQWRTCLEATSHIVKYKTMI